LWVGSFTHTPRPPMVGPRRRATARRARNLRTPARGPGAGIGPPDRIFLLGTRPNRVKTSKFLRPRLTHTHTSAASGRLPTPQSHCPRLVQLHALACVTVAPSTLSPPPATRQVLRTATAQHALVRGAHGRGSAAAAVATGRGRVVESERRRCRWPRRPAQLHARGRPAAGCLEPRHQPDA
jgi:hypothetical protein